MQREEDRKPHSFFKGISLSEYMRDVSCPEDMDKEGRSNEETNDLYLQCEPQHSIANYAIEEVLDEENYEETGGPLEFIVRPHHTSDLQKARVVQGDEAKTKLKGNPIKRSNYQFNKNQANSPFKDGSPKKEMFRSLYGHSFGGEQGKSVERGQLLSTLGMGSWRSKHKSLSKREGEVREKNRRQYQQLIKYEHLINRRLDTKLNSIRIDGIKDKIHDRSSRTNKKDTHL